MGCISVINKTCIPVARASNFSGYTTELSGLIRRLLGPTKARLQGYIKQARTIFMVLINVSDLEGEEVGLEDLIQRISMNIALLERCNKDWTTYELKGEEHIKEEKEYLWAADGDDGIIELILDSNETVARLQGRLTQEEEKVTSHKLGYQNRIYPLLMECPLLAGILGHFQVICS